MMLSKSQKTISLYLVKLSTRLASVKSHFRISLLDFMYFVFTQTYFILGNFSVLVT